MLEAPYCFKRKCKHYLGVFQSDGTEMTEVSICEAYPDGIPEDIILGQDLHLTVRSDQDNDIVFEEIED